MQTDKTLLRGKFKSNESEKKQNNPAQKKLIPSRVMMSHGRLADPVAKEEFLALGVHELLLDVHVSERGSAEAK